MFLLLEIFLIAMLHKRNTNSIKVVVKFQPDGTMSFASKVKIETVFQMTPAKMKKDDIPYRTFPDTPISYEGTIKGKELTVKITAQPGKMPFPVTYNYVGQK